MVEQRRPKLLVKLRAEAVQPLQAADEPHIGFPLPLPVGNLPGCLFVPIPRRLVPCDQFVPPSLVFLLVRGCGLVLRHNPFDHSRHRIHLGQEPVLLHLQLRGVIYRPHHHFGVRYQLILFRDDRIDRLHEGILYLILGKVRRPAFLIVLELMVALEDHPAVFVLRVPYLGAVPVPALGTLNL